MDNIKAFGVWDTELLEGNPFHLPGVQKIFLADPRVALIFDTNRNRIGFVAQRVAATNKFTLPKANRSAAEKKMAVYYAIYSPADEWVIEDGGYLPHGKSSVWNLVRELFPSMKHKQAAEQLREQIRQEEMESIRKVVAESEELLPYKNFPLNQRQMIQQAAYMQGIPPVEYINKFMAPEIRKKSLERFGVDTSGGSFT